MLIVENQPNVGAGFLILIHRGVAPTAAQPVGRDSHLDISLSILENRPTKVVIPLGFTVFICKRTLLKSGTTIVVDRDLPLTVQPNLLSNVNGVQQLGLLRMDKP